MPFIQTLRATIDEQTPPQMKTDIQRRLSEPQVNDIVEAMLAEKTAELMRLKQQNIDFFNQHHLLSNHAEQKAAQMDILYEKKSLASSSASYIMSTAHPVEKVDRRGNIVPDIAENQIIRLPLAQAAQRDALAEQIAQRCYALNEQSEEYVPVAASDIAAMSTILVLGDHVTLTEDVLTQSVEHLRAMSRAKQAFSQASMPAACEQLINNIFNIEQEELQTSLSDEDQETPQEFKVNFGYELLVNSLQHSSTIQGQIEEEVEERAQKSIQQMQPQASSTRASSPKFGASSE